MNESYTILIDKSKGIKFYTETILGVIRAFETLSQLFIYNHNRVDIFQINNTPIRIYDDARFQYRGKINYKEKEFLLTQVKIIGK
jgi:hypothetical protein